METTTRHGAIAGKTQTTETNFYNLDAILSVGYRVNSKNATAFRIWANQVLKQYLLQGYAINERVAAQKYDELSQLVKVLGRTIQNQEKLTEDSRSLLDVVVDYTYALDTLDRYDDQELKIEDTTGKEAFHATYENAMEVICELHEKCRHRRRRGSLSLKINTRQRSMKLVFIYFDYLCRYKSEYYGRFNPPEIYLANQHNP